MEDKIFQRLDAVLTSVHRHESNCNGCPVTSCDSISCARCAVIVKLRAGVCRLEGKVAEVDFRTKQVEQLVHDLAESRQGAAGRNLEHCTYVTPDVAAVSSTDPALKQALFQSNHPWQTYQQLLRKDALSDALHLSHARSSRCSASSSNGGAVMESTRKVASQAQPGPCAEAPEEENRNSRWSALTGKMALDRGFVRASLFMCTSPQQDTLIYCYESQVLAVAAGSVQPSNSRHHSKEHVTKPEADVMA